MKPTLAGLRAQCPDIPEPALNEYLARRVLGPDSTAEHLMTELAACQQRVRRTYTKHLLAATHATATQETVEKGRLHGKVKNKPGIERGK